eukprot:2239439-Pleurochrysis_carterae.AAC.3
MQEGDAGMCWFSVLPLLLPTDDQVIWHKLRGLVATRWRLRRVAHPVPGNSKSIPGVSATPTCKYRRSKMLACTNMGR